MWRHIAWVGSLAACTATGPHAPGTPDHHRQDGFANETGVTGTDPVEFLLDRSRLALGLSGGGRAVALSPEQAVAMWGGLGSRDAMQWLGHASIRLRLGGQTVLIDPVMGDRASPVQFAGPPRLSEVPVPTAKLADTNVILITHNHYDHFDEPAIGRIHAVSGAPCVVPIGLQTGGALHCPAKAVDWDNTVRSGALRITLKPAQHESGRSLLDRDKSLWGSWLIETNKRRIYVTGDTGYGPHFAAQGATGPVDLAVINVGGYAPRGFNKHVHLSPEEAIRAADDLKAKRVLIAHWGTYPLGLEDAAETIARLTRAAAKAGWPDDRLLAVPIGTAFAL